MVTISLVTASTVVVLVTNIVLITNIGVYNNWNVTTTIIRSADAILTHVLLRQQSHFLRIARALI